MHRGAAWLLLAGCGRLGFGSTDAGDARATADTRTGDALAIDAPADAPPDMLPPADALAPCTKLGFSDNFDDGVRAAVWTQIANNPVNVAEAGGQLQVMLATAGGAHYGGYDSAASWNLRDHCMSVAFAGVPTSEAMVEMDFLVRTAAGTTGITYHQDMIDPFVNTGTFSSLGALPYNPTAHKVLLVREDAGTMTYETSPDGITYTIIAQTPTPFDVSTVTVALEAGTFGSAPTPGTALYDDFDIP